MLLHIIYANITVMYGIFNASNYYHYADISFHYYSFFTADLVLTNRLFCFFFHTKRTPKLWMHLVKSLKAIVYFDEYSSVGKLLLVFCLLIISSWDGIASLWTFEVRRHIVLWLSLVSLDLHILLILE